MNAELVPLRGRGARIVLFWMVVILVVVIDQATKAGVDVITDAGPQVLIPGILDITYVENSGAAFSIGQGGGAVFVCVAIAFILGAVYFVWTTQDLPLSLVVSIGLVAGGGMGNLVDRVMKGSVTDFLATAFMDFPVFNVADICVTVGVFVTVVGYWVWDAKRERAQAQRLSTAHHDEISNA